MMSNDDMNLCVLALRRRFPLCTCRPYVFCFCCGICKRHVSDIYIYVLLDSPKAQQSCTFILNGAERISPRTLQNEKAVHGYAGSTSTANLR